MPVEDQNASSEKLNSASMQRLISYSETVADRVPVVGIGASAGGLAAFAAFFSGMPTTVEPGMAFVLVQHLAPDHGSLLAELIQRTTRMKVVEVQDGMVVHINCVYIIPPNRDMAFLNGALHLLGWDHENIREAECMEQLEREILAGLGLPDPYLER